MRKNTDSTQWKEILLLHLRLIHPKQSDEPERRVDDTKVDNRMPKNKYIPPQFSCTEGTWMTMDTFNAACR